VTEKPHDVVIVGAGPAGSASAYFLARRGLDVLLLDKSPFPRDKTCGDGLTPRALEVLRRMTLLDSLDPVGQRIRGIEIHSPRGHAIEMPVPKKDGYPDYLMIVPRLELDDRIRERALSAGAAFHGQVRVRGVGRENGGVTIQGERNRGAYRARGRIAILATGANIRLLKTLGLMDETPPTVLAARAYFEGVAGLEDRVQARFERVPLPGYGWVFPLSRTSANIGVGFWPHGLAGRWMPSSTRAAFDSFLRGPGIQRMLADARQLGPVKSYPIRIDFPTAPTHGDGVLLVGETAGLVSPLTGEGIDFALESGMLAAEHIAGMFSAGDFSSDRFEDYDRLLRRHFQRLFIFLNRIRKLYINPVLLNRFVSVARRHLDLRELLVNILLGHQDAADGVSARTVRKVLLGW
jgi:geranylgeranyl reductase family protein